MIRSTGKPVKPLDGIDVGSADAHPHTDLDGLGLKAAARTIARSIQHLSANESEVDRLAAQIEASLMGDDHAICQSVGDAEVTVDHMRDTGRMIVSVDDEAVAAFRTHGVNLQDNDSGLRYDQRWRRQVDARIADFATSGGQLFAAVKPSHIQRVRDLAGGARPQSPAEAGVVGHIRSTLPWIAGRNAEAARAQTLADTHIEEMSAVQVAHRIEAQRKFFDRIDAASGGDKPTGGSRDLRGLPPETQIELYQQMMIPAQLMPDRLHWFRVKHLAETATETEGNRLQVAGGAMAIA